MTPVWQAIPRFDAERMESLPLRQMFQSCKQVFLYLDGGMDSIAWEAASGKCFRESIICVDFWGL
jgi:hypothetical protein